MSKSYFPKKRYQANRDYCRKKKYTSIVRKVPKTIFWPTRLQHNGDPILSLKIPNKLYIAFIFYWRVCSSFCSSVCPSVCLSIFLELCYCFFLNFGILLESRVRLCLTKQDFLGNFVAPKIGKMGPKWAKNRFFFNLLENLVINFCLI